MVKRAAFSMIELIFAIVVVAIAVLTLPVMVDVTSSSSSKNIIIQEMIFEGYIALLEKLDEGFITSGTSQSALENNAATGKEGLKFANNVNFNVTHPSSFYVDTSDNGISLVEVRVTNAESNRHILLKSYDFNVSE